MKPGLYLTDGDKPAARGATPRSLDKAARGASPRSLDKAVRGVSAHSRVELALYLMDVEKLADPALFSAWYGRMPEKRRRKIDAFRPESARRLSLGAGILLEMALREQLRGEQIRNLLESVAEEPCGKPFFPGRPELHFNLSHSGHMAALALSPRPVGVDIQEVTHFGESLLKYVFSDDERGWIRSAGAPGRGAAGSGARVLPAADEGSHLAANEGSFLTADDRALLSADERATLLWTVKESVMKYFGEGLKLEPRRIRTEPEGDRRVRRITCEGHSCDGLHLRTFRVSGCALCVCCEDAAFPETYRMCDPATS